MYFSEAEREMVLAMRAAVEAEVRTLTNCLEQADAIHSELINTNQYLEVENRELTKALDNHGICAPWPESQL
jgi:regulator of replication initiation timing